MFNSTFISVVALSLSLVSPVGARLRSHTLVNTAVTPSAYCSSYGTYYVSSQSGNDSYDGMTIATPFKTIQKCASVVNSGESCVIRGGFYPETITPSKSGGPSQSITFISYCGEVPVVSGADLVQSSWSLLSGVSSSNKIYQTNILLRPSNDTSYMTANQVFLVDQMTSTSFTPQMINEARWPSTTPTTGPHFYPWATTITKVKQKSNSTSGVMTWVLYDSTLTKISTVKNALVGAVVNIMSGRRYQNTGAKVTGYDPSGKSITINMEYSVDESDTSINPGIGSPYNLVGLLAFLNGPSQWSYKLNSNKTTGVLSLWMPTGDSPATHKVAVKQRDLAFNLAARSNIVIEGLEIFASRIQTDASSSNIIINGIHGDYLTHASYISMSSESGLRKKSGIQIYGSKNKVINSILNMSAGNLIVLFGDNHLVQNNLLTGADYSGTGPSAINISSSNSQILNNTIRTTGSNGIHVLGIGSGPAIPGANSNLTVAYNNVSDFGRIARDLGGIYICCGHNGDFTGSSVHHNWFHDSFDPYAGTSFGMAQDGIYYDAGADNMSTHHNLVWNVNTGLIYKDENDIPKYPSPQHDNFYNNTVWNTSRSSSLGGSSNTLNCAFTNNIFDRPPVALGNFSGKNLTAPAVATTFVNGLGPSYDLHLVSGSLAIDKAINIPGITTNVVGAAPDFGAYEYGAPDWLPGCSLSGC